MDKEKIKEIIGNNLPSGICFSFSDDRLEIVLNSKSVFGNMQEDRLSKRETILLPSV